jgi:hypothetical protein
MSGQARPGRPASALGHPLRAALLDLLAEHAMLTSTQAARELGESSGACSFHLRQLARFGEVEEVPGDWGRARPWRLTAGAGRGDRGGRSGDGAAWTDDQRFGELARELEDEGYRRWLAGRTAAPPGWHDEAFSTVLYLTPERMTELAAEIRAVIVGYATEDAPDEPPRGGGHSAGFAPGNAAAVPPRGGGTAAPAGIVVRLFPLLPPAADG